MTHLNPDCLYLSNNQKDPGTLNCYLERPCWGFSDPLELGGGACALSSANLPLCLVRGQLVHPLTPTSQPQAVKAAALVQEERSLGEKISPPLEVFAQGCYRMNISFHNVANHFPLQAGVEPFPSSSQLWCPVGS